MIFPADAPRIVRLSGYGIHITLEQGVGSQRKYEDVWRVGRAGMQYRDLIADRLGGNYIASHIRIPIGGPVPDYVHHHEVRFQMIFCYRGWVQVVYEDQGPPFVMQAGDCVLQPPHIRHRVIASSDNMEVIEVSSPAEHETLVDHDMELPTASVCPDRDFSGQQFVYHEQSEAVWTAAPYTGFAVRDTGIGQATDGLAAAQVVRASAALQTATIENSGDLCFLFVLQGSITLRRKSQEPRLLAAGDSFVIAVGEQIVLSESSMDLEFLQVTTALACIIHEDSAGVSFSLPQFNSKHITALRWCSADAVGMQAL